MAEQRITQVAAITPVTADPSIAVTQAVGVTVNTADPRMYVTQVVVITACKMGQVFKAKAIG